MNSLTTAYLLDIVPIDKFASATGIINLFRGFGCVLGQYFGGENIVFQFYRDKKNCKR